MSTITVYHAELGQGAFERFTDSTKIQGVYQYERDVTALNVHEVLENAFYLFNQDTDAIPHDARCTDDECILVGCARFTAESYRTVRLRSLSVGDVVVIGGKAGGPLPDGTGPGEQAYAVASMGFDPVHVLPEQILPLEVHRPSDALRSV